MDKPIYTIPSMVEINQIPYSDYSGISTFSGGGGSCLGYRMAGLKILWANEFNPDAQATYRANFPDTILDGRDIRTVTGEEILEVLDLKPGQLDFMDGSPPCNPFSMIGKRQKSWNKQVKYAHTEQRVDNLFFEYIRILDILKPRVFIAENVAGLVRGTAKGYFKEIFLALKNCGYRVNTNLIKANWLGVPTLRPRVFFIGVREDLGLDPVFPKPLPYQYTLRDACPWIELPDDHPDVPKIKYPRYVYIQKHHAAWQFWDETPIGKSHHKRYTFCRCDPDKPVRTIVQLNQGSAASPAHPYIKRKFSISELKRINSFPEDYILTGGFKEQSARIGLCVVPLVAKALAETIISDILKVADNKTG